jgi:hypothetical protein
MRGGPFLFLLGDRHCEERSDEAIHTFYGDGWIASLSLSSGAHSRDPLARNDEAHERRKLTPPMKNALPVTS